MKIAPRARLENIVVQELESEILVYDLTKNKAYCLNQTSALIWQECDGTKSVDEMSRILSRKLKLKVSQELVWLALSQFKTDQLLENGHELVTPFDGLNRREIVKRIGFASMVALPIVASIVAPTALEAQSGAVCNCNTGGFSRPPGCLCQSPFQCCSGSCFDFCTNTDVGQPASCCPAVVGCLPPSSPANPPGCLCNSDANCASFNCVAIPGGSICAL